MTDAAEVIESEEDDDNSSQFVTFHVADEGFGFSMEEVAEIIRVPDTVGVPLTPNALVGLANLRGNVLPILDLRRILNLEESTYTDATRVIVADAGRPVGLIVDRVAKVISVDVSKIEKAGNVKSTTDTELLSGVIKDNDTLVQLLEVKQIIKQDFDSVINSANNGKSEQSNETISAEQDELEEDDLSQLVSFTVDKQEYAFDLMEIEEIVRVPENIAEMPSTDHHVLGIIDLRGRLLPLVSLRRMFDLEDVGIGENNRILVINIRSVGGAVNSVGIVVDDVKEVLNIPHSLRDKVPSLLSSDSETDISAVCRLDGGKCLVSILSAEVMFETDALKAAVVATKDENSAMNETQEEQEDSLEDDDTQMVVFKLADQEYGVTIEDVQEITRVPDEMSKVPKTADFIEGMVNLRGTVLPVLDMRARFSLERMERNERQRILVLNLDGSRTGFIMDSVVEVLRLNRFAIEDAPDLSDDQTRVMGRVVNMKEDKRMIQVIDVHELLSKKEQKALGKL